MRHLPVTLHWRAAGGFLLLALLCAAPFSARAARAVGVYVEGPEADLARAELSKAIPNAFEIVPDAEFKDALKGAGLNLKKGAGDAISVEKKRGSLVEKARYAASTAAADGAVLARVRKQKKNKRDLWILVLDTKDGEVLLDRAVPLSGAKGLKKRSKKEKQADAKRITEAITPAFDQLARSGRAAPPPPPSEETKQPVAAEPPAGEEPPPERRAVATEEPGIETEAGPDEPRALWYGTAMFDLAAGLEVAGRHFEYTDPVTDNLRPYDVFGVPVLAVGGEIYPLASSDISVVKDLGIKGSFGQAVGITSQVPDGPTLDTAWRRWDAGLKGRLRTGGQTSPVVGLGAGVGNVGFHFTNAPADLAGELPDVGYQFVRVGADMRFSGHRYGVVTAASFLNVTSAGEVADRFPSASQNGLELGLGGTYRVIDHVEARVALAYTRFWYDLQPAVGDEYVAGGALDELFGLSLGAAFLY